MASADPSYIQDEQVEEKEMAEELAGDLAGELDRGRTPDGGSMRPSGLNDRLLSAAEKNERISNMFQTGLQFHFSGEEMEACKAIETKLFQHQRVALAWMSNKENVMCDGLRGGILADDMGLGKTLTVIALVFTNFWDKKPFCKPELCFTREPLGKETANKGKGKAKEKFNPKSSAKDLGVGSKLKGEPKKTIGGMFDKFKQGNSSHSESAENRKAFSFGISFKKTRGESSEDEDDAMFLDDSEEEEPLDPRLNVDGFCEDESSDEERECRPSKKRNKIDSSDEEEGTGMIRPARKIVRRVLSVSSESDLSLPELDEEEQEQDTASEVRAEPSKVKDAAEEEGGRESSTNMKLIIPPRQPAERRGRRGATLVVCPTSLISHWVDQLDRHLSRAVDVKLKIHHGNSKAATRADLETFDIVITTYGTLASEFGSLGPSPLLSVKWLRVVLDEGHMIKNHLTKTAKAAMQLDTIRKWIITGTPIQNNLMEFWSLINWLDFGAYAGRSNMRHYKNDIDRLCKNGDPRGFDRLQLLIDAVCLRRTKTDKRPDGTPLVNLPSKTVITRAVDLDEVETVIYKLYQTQAQRIVAMHSKRNCLLKNYAYIFALMVRLRQLCCHREMIKDIDWAKLLKDVDGLKKQLEEMLNKEEQKGTGARHDPDIETDELMRQLRDMIRSGVTEDCSICLDDLKTPVITPCGHVFCRACIEPVIQSAQTPLCPMCRGPVAKDRLLEAGRDEEEDDEVATATAADMEDIEVKISSSKVNAAIKEMLRIKRDHPDDKIVVVSQFTSFLSIIQPLIREQGFSFVRLDG